MNTVPLGYPYDRRHYLQCWGFSLIAHALLVVGAMAVVTDLKLAPQPEPFRWNVAVVDVPTQQVVPRASSPAQFTPPTPSQARRRPVETRPVVQSIQRIVHQETKQIVETSVPIQQTVHQIMQPAQQSTEVKTRPIESVQASVQAITEAPSIMNPTPIEESGRVPQAVTEAPSIVNPTPIVTERETAIQQIAESLSEVMPAPVMKDSQPLVADTASVSAVGSPVISEPMVETTRTIIEAHQSRAIVREPVAVREQTMAKELPSRSIPATKADYGWLVEALWNRVEQLKRYPHLARVNRWEGKVILRAVIREDGQLMGLEVAESSGHSILDNDAIEVLKKASPLKLKYPLGQPRVVVDVPISYKLQ